MKSKIFQVYDSKAEAYLPIFTAATIGLAERSFATAAQKSGHDFNTYAADFTLFCTGEVENDTAGITPYKAHINLGTALTHVHTVGTDVPPIARPQSQSEGPPSPPISLTST